MKKIIVIKAEPLEKVIQREICDFLFSSGFFFWRSNNIPVFSQNNAGKFVYRTLPKYTPRGLPDIILLYKGNFVAFEVKRGNAKLRPEQAEFGVKCTVNEGHYYVVNSVEQVKKSLNDLKIEIKLKKTI